MLANYQSEQRALESLIATTAPPNILLLQGAEGSGKSALLQEALAKIDSRPLLHLDLKGSANTNTVATFFDLAGRTLGWDRFPTFVDTVAGLTGPSARPHDDLWLLGMRRHVQAITRIQDIESRLSIFRPLTESWLIDLKQSGDPVLLAIDSFETGSVEFERWLAEEFLPLAVQFPALRIAVCGQKKPAVDPSWSTSAQTIELNGVQDSAAWQAWAAASGLQNNPDFIKGVVVALNGQPVDIATVIQTNLPRQPAPEKATAQAETDQSPATGPMSLIERRRFRKNLVDFFSLTHIKTLCFDLGINHERLPSDGSVDGLVLELLSFLNRRPTLIPAFVTICREERPDLSW